MYIHKIQWMHRNEMLKRAVRMVQAHWRKNLEWSEVERWYRKELPHYAKISYSSLPGKGVSDKMTPFLNEAVRLAELEYEYLGD
jgi:hypothetical protein